MSPRVRPLQSVFALLLTLGVASQAPAGVLDPPGIPAPTMKTLDEVEPRKPIHAADLPLTISAPGSYYLAESIVTGGGGILISASNVSVDLRGFTMDGGTGSGISASAGILNLAVRNGTLTGWAGSGLDLSLATNCTIVDVRAQANGGRGIYVGRSGVITNSTATDNGSVGIQTGDGSVIRGCTARDNVSHGMLGGMGVTVEACASLSNDLDGISVGPGSLVTNSTATQNLNDGIAVNTGLNTGMSTIRGCTCYNNRGDGIEVRSVTFVVGNTCAQNGDFGGDSAGIHTVSPFGDNRIEDNLVQNNDRGIDVDQAGNIIIGNTATGNGVNFDILAGNFVGTIVASEAAMNAAPNGLINIAF